MDCSVPIGEVRGRFPIEDWRGTRWLDLLVALDRLGGKSCPPPPGPTAALPELTGLRAACLRAGMASEVLQERLAGGASSRRDQAKALFEGLLGPGSAQAAAWLDAWHAQGGGAGLLLRLPLCAVAPRRASGKAWMLRCLDALRAHRKELRKAFETANSATASTYSSLGRTEEKRLLLVSGEQFRRIFSDVMRSGCLEAETPGGGPTWLSEADVADLALYAAPAGSPGAELGAAAPVSGAALLRLAEGEDSGPTW